MLEEAKRSQERAQEQQHNAEQTLSVKQVRNDCDCYSAACLLASVVAWSVLFWCSKNDSVMLTAQDVPSQNIVKLATHQIASALQEALAGC